MRRKLAFLAVYFSPFKFIKPQLYIGKLKFGTPYFYPRVRTKNGFVDKVIGFDFVGLGWKYKWEDYRFEWNPIWSFVFFKLQIAIHFIPEHYYHYWEAWLYYSRDTDKTKSKKERIQQCMEEFPLFYEVHNKGEQPKAVDYYQLIIKPEYL